MVILATGLMAAFDSGRTLMVRALMPMMNIDRARTALFFSRGRQHGGAGECELRSGSGAGRETRLLIASGSINHRKGGVRSGNDLDAVGEYATTIAVESQDVDYRAHAGDAVSRRYTLVSRQRPRFALCEDVHLAGLRRSPTGNAIRR